MRTPYNSISRRRFAFGSAAAGFAALTARKGSAFAATPTSSAIDLARPIGEIRPELHGQFAEHLGSCIYGGLWVGPDSPIPNVRGYRKQAVEYLSALDVPVLRWPGGCFADDYHWRDGIGPRAKRPKTVNVHWGGYVEDNSFGTQEFVGLCRLIGAAPYLAGNVGSGSPTELRDWMEYCNYPSGSTLSDARAADGSSQPFNVRYWGVGNENWGCGGNMLPEEYAQRFRQFTTYLHGFGDRKPFLVACGPSRNNLEWTRRFFDNMNHRYGQIGGYTMHFYSRGLNHATEFTAAQMEEQFATFPQLEKAIGEQRGLLDNYDPQRKIGLMVDEWGVWDRIDPADEKAHGRLWQQITMRSAVAAALGLNIFHRHADKLVMCNIAQIVNVLHSLLLTEGEHCVRTTTYYTYELVKPHRGGTSVSVQEPSAPGLSISASRQENDLAVTFVNSQAEESLNVDCAVTGGSIGGGSARILHDPDRNAFNGFDTPDLIVPKSHPVSVEGGRIRIELPALSIATALVRLA